MMKRIFSLHRAATDDIRHRAAIVAKWLGAVLIFLTGAGQAWSQAHYDPRSWSYDPAYRVVAPSAPNLAGPSAVDRASDLGSQDGESQDVTRRIVAFQTAFPEGSILINTTQRRLYYILGQGRALRYVVGVGKEGFEWQGRDRITAKKDWPDWRPPADMRAREAARGHPLPAFVAGGPNNPLGARALYIGQTYYRIHGTNQPWTVGTANSSGCIRMTNDDVMDLYDRVAPGTLVVVTP